MLNVVAQPTFEPSTSTSARDHLLTLGTTRRFSTGEVIVEEGRSLDHLHVVAQGQIKMSRLTPAGKNLILTLFGPGDLFGVTAAIGGDECSATFTAASETECQVIERRELFGLLAARPDLVPEIFGLLTGKLAECHGCLVEAACSRVETRFAHLFVNLSSKLGTPVGDDQCFIPLSLSRQDLADMAGTTIETAIRIMSRWNKEGLVTTEADGFLIGDPDALVMMTWN